MNNPSPIISINRTETKMFQREEAFLQLSQQFAEQNFIRLPGILNKELLHEFHEQIESGGWQERVHDHIGTEVCASDKGLVGLLNFLMNDVDLFHFLERVTGCEKIGCFAGRVYRMVPNSGHYDSWHGDVGENRLLALSMNFGYEPHDGGILEIRKRRPEAAPTKVPNPGFGDAILFRISPELEHRVTNVVGSVPKTAFAGWFQSEPDFLESLRR